MVNNVLFGEDLENWFQPHDNFIQLISEMKLLKHIMQFKKRMNDWETQRMTYTQSNRLIKIIKNIEQSAKQINGLG